MSIQMSGAAKQWFTVVLFDKENNGTYVVHVQAVSPDAAESAVMKNLYEGPEEECGDKAEAQFHAWLKRWRETVVVACFKGKAELAYDAPRLTGAGVSGHVFDAEHAYSDSAFEAWYESNVAAA